MPLISQSSIQELNDHLDAISVVSDYAKLEKRGNRFWACCPFHQEKTASFTVNPDLKTYYCFGCHKGGTMINFVMELDKITFPEAIELLAKKFSIKLAYENSGTKGYSPEEEAEKKAKDELFELYRRISGTFHHFFLKKPEAQSAKHYIIKRGISSDMIERFGLGYSPADRYWLHKFLSRKGYSKEFLAKSGLFSSRHPQLSLFSGRLMFPIADRQGRIVAFGGRYLPVQAAEQQEREAPKYINSPELGIYKKGETLYAIDHALPEIRRTKTAYMAEGYMDVIALHQAGIHNALAPLGTAFTDEQAKLLKRWADKIIFFFDGDEAGQAASLKGIYTCRKNGLAAAIVYVGPGDSSLNDPADILTHSGPEALQKKAKNFITDFDYLLIRARSLFNTSNSEGKAQAVVFLFPYLDLLESEVARDSCMELAADAFGLLPKTLAEDYRRYIRKEEHSQQTETKAPISVNNELSLLIAVAVNYVSPMEKGEKTEKKEKIFPKFRSALEISDIEDSNAKELFIALEECIRYGETGMDELLERIPSPELKRVLLERSVSGEFTVNAEKLVFDGIRKIREKGLKQRQEEIILKLRGLKKLKNTDEDRSTEEKELLADKIRIDDELYNLKQGNHA